MRDVMIVDAMRTPIGRRNGSLSGLRPDDTLGKLINHVLNRRLGIDPSHIQDFTCGCVTQIGEQGLNVARNAILAGGLPYSIPGVTVNRQEGSGLQAIAFAAQAIACGDMDAALAGGVEFMSRQPMGSDGFGDHIAHLGSGVSPRLFERFGSLMSQGMAAELLAKQCDLQREELDEYAKRSLELATSAIASGFFASEVMPLEVPASDGRSFILENDEISQQDITLEELASLQPAFKSDGVTTAGNSAAAADGAAVLVLMAEEKCSELGLKPQARYICTAVSGGDPAIMLTAPIGATRMALARAGLSVEDIDLFEISESFAAIPLAWMRELMPPRPERVNAWGGAIAIGNPLGAVGAKLACTVISGLAALKGKYGLVSTSTGMGMGIATILERT